VAACLGWNEGDEHRYTKAEIVNVSMTGIVLRVDDLPPEKCSLWVRLEPPHPTEWVGAELVKVESGSGKSSTVRLRFRTSCPYDIFKAAVNGFTHQSGFMTLHNDLTSAKYW
jgi:hypothetical protein